jgi:hypothetical protein
LKRVEAELTVPEICRELGVSAATFYKWRAKYGEIDTSLMARIKELEVENVSDAIQNWAEEAGIDSNTSSHPSPSKMPLSSVSTAQSVASGYRSTTGKTLMKSEITQPVGYGPAIMNAQTLPWVASHQLSNYMAKIVNQATCLRA